MLKLSSLFGHHGFPLPKVARSPLINHLADIKVTSFLSKV